MHIHIIDDCNAFDAMYTSTYFTAYKNNWDHTATELPDLIPYKSQLDIHMLKRSHLMQSIESTAV